MNSTQLSKIAAAIVMTLLAMIVIGKLTSFVYAPQTPDKPGFAVAVEEAHDTVAVEQAPQVDLAALMAVADVAKGQTVAKKCIACHTFEKGGKDKAGPNLYIVLNRELASNDGYKYSKAFVAKNAEGTKWGYEELFEFFKKPSAYIKGTAMGFGGIKKETQSADLIAYVRSLSENPAELPMAQ